MSVKREQPRSISPLSDGEGLYTITTMDMEWFEFAQGVLKSVSDLQSQNVNVTRHEPAVVKGHLKNVYMVGVIVCLCSSVLTTAYFRGIALLRVVTVMWHSNLFTFKVMNGGQNGRAVHRLSGTKRRAWQNATLPACLSNNVLKILKLKSMVRRYPDQLNIF